MRKFFVISIIGLGFFGFSQTIYGAISLTNGTTYIQGENSIPWTDDLGCGGGTDGKHTVFSVTTNNFVGTDTTGASGNIMPIPMDVASTTGTYSILNPFNGDTNSACMTGSGGYTACVSATFCTETIFYITTSTPTSSMENTTQVCETIDGVEYCYRSTDIYITFFIEFLIVAITILGLVWIFRKTKK